MGAIIRGVLAWIAGAVVAVGVGMLALGRIGYGLPADSVQPLSPRADLRPVLSPGAPVEGSGASATATAGPPATPATSVPPRSGPSSARPRRSPSTAPPAERTLTSAGGSAIVRCADGAAYLVSWSPEQGYHVDDVRRGPAAVVSVRFEGKDRKVVLSARCVGGTPQGRVGGEEEDDEE